MLQLRWYLALESFRETFVSLHLLALEDFPGETQFHLELRRSVDHALPRPAIVDEELPLCHFESLSFLEETGQPTLLIKWHENMLLQHFSGQLATFSLSLRVLFLRLPDRCDPYPLQLTRRVVVDLHFSSLVDNTEVGPSIPD